MNEDEIQGKSSDVVSLGCIEHLGGSVVALAMGRG